jgi:hypothetical protein
MDPHVGASYVFLQTLPNNPLSMSDFEIKSLMTKGKVTFFSFPPLSSQLDGISSIYLE